MPPAEGTAVLAEMPPPEEPPAQIVPPAGWPFDAAEAQRRQAGAGTPTRLTIELGAGINMELVRIPAGEFILGDPSGYPDERPVGVVNIARPFWIGACEVTNEQFRQFCPEHDSGSEPMLWLKWHPGHFVALNQPRQPVCRVSWEEANAFCRWLSQKTGRTFTLPDESQWEWACRAGTDSPWSFGELASDCASFANFADDSLLELGRLAAMEKVKPFFAVEPVNDKQTVSAPVGSYQPNPWGLYDMHGNVAEWTSSAYLAVSVSSRRSGPRCAGNTPSGSRRLLAAACRAGRSGWRTGYWPWQSVFNVGFRVVCEAEQ